MTLLKAFSRIATAGLALPLLPAPLFAAPSQASEPAGELVVEVRNVRAEGTVHVDICPQSRFLKDDCPYMADVPARIGTTRVIVRGIPPGRYAAQVFLDENGNHKVDRNFLGIPKEGVGFSNDAPIRLSPPRFSDAVFARSGGNQTIALSLRYFLGPKGPA